MATTTVAPKQDISEVWTAYKLDPGNKQLRNRLVENYLPLVKYNGERIWARLPDGVELDDLISAGVFGLMDAINAFDMNRGVKFETYCVPRIRGAMLDELRSMDWVPRLVRSKASKLNEAVKKLEAQLGRSPNENELAEQMGISLQELEKLITDANAVNLISLNKKWYETDSYKDVREIDILEDKKGEDPTRRVQKSDLMRLVTKGLNRNGAVDYHSLLLRRTDDEGDRRDARSLRKPRQPDAQRDRRSPEGPTRSPSTGIQCGRVTPHHCAISGAKPGRARWARPAALSDPQIVACNDLVTVLVADRFDHVLQEFIDLLRCATNKSARIAKAVEVDVGKSAVAFETADQIVGTPMLLDLSRGRLAVLTDEFVELLPIATGGCGFHEHVLGNHERQLIGQVLWRSPRGRQRVRSPRCGRL